MTFYTVCRFLNATRLDFPKILDKYFKERKGKDELGGFCLQHFVQIAEEKFEKEPGTWFRSTTFVLALAKIIKIYPEFDRLRLFNVTENIIYWKKLAKKAFFEK